MYVCLYLNFSNRSLKRFQFNVQFIDAIFQIQ